MAKPRCLDFSVNDMKKIGPSISVILRCVLKNMEVKTVLVCGLPDCRGKLVADEWYCLQVSDLLDQLYHPIIIIGE